MFLWNSRRIGQFMSPLSVLDCHVIENSDSVLCNLYVHILIQIWLMNSQ